MISYEEKPLSNKQQDMLAVMKTLPQYPHMAQHDIRAFLENFENNPRCYWHIQRLGGIGGSEIGVVVYDVRGEKDPFGETVNNIAKQKLLQVQPKKQTYAMARGVWFERVVRHVFREQYGAKTDFEAKKILSTTKDTPRPWMRYSPDDVVIIDGKRLLVDYKTPTEAALHNEISLRYRAQLHLGYIIGAYNDLKLDGMMLVQAPQNGNEEIVLTQVEFDNELAKDIIMGGDKLWNDVVSGIVPPAPPMSPQVELTDSEAEEITKFSTEMVKYKVITDQLNARIDTLRGEIERVLAMKYVGEKSMLYLPGYNVTVSAPKLNAPALVAVIGEEAKSAIVPVYDEDKMIDFLKSNNVDLTQFETGKTQWDQAKLISLAEAQGIDHNYYSTNSYLFKLNVDESYKEMAQQFSLKASEALPDFVAKERKEKKTKAKMS